MLFNGNVKAAICCSYNCELGFTRSPMIPELV
jgi:hypothetical protein